MRTLIACGVVGLILGLAAQWWPRAPENDVSARRSEEPVAEQRADVVASVVVAHAPVIAPAVTPDEPVSEGQADDSATAVASAVVPDSTARLIFELRRARIEREYAATGTIRPLNASMPTQVEQALRSRLGDDEYEKYLAATGQTTRIRVGDVESDSVAANAGIQSGDEIVEYAGQRVFTLSELSALMLRTSEGETVKATVVRDGQPIQLYVSGGALGISQSKKR